MKRKATKQKSKKKFKKNVLSWFFLIQQNFSNKKFFSKTKHKKNSKKSKESKKSREKLYFSFLKFSFHQEKYNFSKKKWKKWRFYPNFPDVEAITKAAYVNT